MGQERLPKSVSFKGEGGSTMEFEQCEIRAQHRSSATYIYYEFIVEAIGPQGSYIVARTPEFPAEEHMVLKSLKPLFQIPSYGNEPDGNAFQRKIFNALVNHLVQTGWEPLAESGPKWYNRRFRRRVSRFIADSAPNTPYTLGDVEEWAEKAQKLAVQYERHPDSTSCRKLAEALMQLGLALERTYRFGEALQCYVDAGQMFEGIALTAEAVKAYQSAERVLNRK